MNRQYLYFPAFTDKADYWNVVPRAAWYLAPHLGTGSRLIFACDFPSKRRGKAPAFLDPGIAKHLDRFNDAVVRCAAEDLVNVARREDAGETIVLLHKADELAAANALAESIGNARIVNVDPQLSQYESSLYLKLTSNDGQGMPEDVEACRDRFDRLAASMAPGRIFLFGTGPSLDTVDFADLPEGEKIVTNSMVVNKDFLRIAKPRIIVAPDPIFHAGCSSYAAEFRKNLIDAMRRYGSYFVFPMRDYGVYKTHMPEDLRERLIGIPLRQSVGLNTDLRTAFHVSTTQNVMTLFLLPLAASLGREIVLAGFDGRPWSESGYFWGHSAKAQINDEMEDIQKAHPAFFDIDYNDYLFRHMRTVADYLKDAESKGIRVVSLTDSHVPAIRGRFVKAGPALLYATVQPEISIVLPCYNASRHLDETVDSIFGQGYADWELVCVDDGSTDDTWAKLTGYAALDRRVRILRQENGGVSVARNTGLEAARGRHLCFIDADDVFYPGALEVRLEKSRAICGRAIVYGPITMHDELGNDLNVSAGNGGIVSFDEFDRWPSCMQTAFGPAHVFKAARFRPGLAYGEDWLYFAEIARTGIELVNCGKEIAKYRWHDKAATQREFERNLVQMSSVFREITADDWENQMLDPKFSAGIQQGKFHHIELSRMYVALTQALFRGDRAMARKILTYINGKVRRGPLLAMRPADIERAAVRTYFKPFGSPALQRAASEHIGYVKTFLEDNLRDPAHGKFVEASRGFIRQVEMNGRSGGLATEPAPVVAPGDGELAARHLWRRSLYRQLRKLPLAERLLDPLKRRYLKQHRLI